MLRIGETVKMVNKSAQSIWESCNMFKKKYEVQIDILDRTLYLYIDNYFCTRKGRL